MRVLFSVRPYIGHLHPMTGLAHQLRLEGDEVEFATAASFCATVRAEGFAALAAGTDPALPENDPQFGVRAIGGKLDDLLRATSGRVPDVIVRDPTDFAPLLAAELLGIPSVTFGFSLYIGPWQWSDLVGPAIAALRSRHGLAPDPALARLHPYLYLDTVPPWFRRSVAPPKEVTTLVAPVVAGPARPRSPRERPIIYLTMGTVYNRDAALFHMVAAALADQPVDLVATVGPDQNPARVFPYPPANLTAARFIPQRDILPRTAAVICHGGFSTVMGALAHGLPVIVVPAGSDHHANAECCEGLGVGITLTRTELTAARVREAVARALADDRLRQTAARLRDLIAELPGPGHAASRVRSLVATW